MRLPKYYRNIFNTQSFVVWQTVLCYSNTISTLVRSLIVLSGITHKINRINDQFRHRWRHDFVLNLHETQQASKLKINSKKIILC